VNIFKIIKAMFIPAPRLTPAECSARIRSGDALLIDVREASEWAGGVAQKAVLLALSDLTGKRTQWAPFLAQHAERELVLYCGAGVRASMAARLLVNEGFRASNAGSLREWAEAGWPVVPPAPDT
jgi:rhodanese-related sulfurtransferase